MYQLSFFVPVDYLESVKNAVFATGAGTQGEYYNCAWQVLGEGQFMPSASAIPFLGSSNKLEKVAEYKVEILCSSENIQNAVIALKKAHPYEEVAFSVVKLENF